MLTLKLNYMKSSQLILTAAVISVFVLSCKKDITEMENTYPGSNASNGALNNFFVQNAPAIQTFTFSASSGGYFTCSGGAVVSVMPGALLYQNNQPVTGNVTLNVQEVYNKKDIILSGAYTTCNGFPLISGGEINVTAYQGSQELKLANNSSVYVTMPAPGQSTMFEFRSSTFNGSTDFTQVGTQPIANTLDSAGNWTYDFALDSLDWTNCDQYYGMANPTQFSIPLPNIFDNHNCMVFVTSDFSNFASKIWDYDSVAHVFNCNYYRLPIGEEFTFTAIAEISGNFYYVSQSVTITENIAVALVPQPCSEAQIMQNLGNL